MSKVTDVKEQIIIPEDVQVSIQESNTVQVAGEKGSLSKVLSHPRIKLSVQKNVVEVSCSGTLKKKEKALVGTFIAHIHNMIKGVSEGFTYHMKTVYSHFPIKTSVEGNNFIIQNFLGERSSRKAKILDNVTVQVQGDSVTVSGIDKEKVGQTAANIERATKVRRRDIRVFQDGVYIVAKGG
jgi:large subunit ribosomal protein L6